MRGVQQGWRSRKIWHQKPKVRGDPCLNFYTHAPLSYHPHLISGLLMEVFFSIKYRDIDKMKICDDKRDKRIEWISHVISICWCCCHYLFGGWKNWEIQIKMLNFIKPFDECYWRVNNNSSRILRGKSIWWEITRNDTMFWTCVNMNIHVAEEKKRKLWYSQFYGHLIFIIEQKICCCCVWCSYPLFGSITSSQREEDDRGRQWWRQINGMLYYILNSVVQFSKAPLTKDEWMKNVYMTAHGGVAHSTKWFNVIHSHTHTPKSIHSARCVCERMSGTRVVHSNKLRNL